jgi:hypothetical protein
MQMMIEMKKFEILKLLMTPAAMQRSSGFQTSVATGGFQTSVLNVDCSGF